MGIVENAEYMPLTDENDPDDYRPDSELAVVIDPADGPGGHVEGLTVFRERIAPGDEIPLHQHREEEVLFVDEGEIEARVGDVQRTVGPGAMVFVPAGAPHGFRNVGKARARIHAVFPTAEVSIRYLERNPAPGTEGDPPAPPVAIDVRELLEGDPEQAWKPLDAGDFAEA